MTRPVRVLMLTGAVVALAGAAVCALTIYTYLAEPFALSSTSGLKVFYQSTLVDSDDSDNLVQYAPFVFGAGPAVLVTGLVVLLASVALSAALWRPRATSD
jgi:hypothetical protein